MNTYSKYKDSGIKWIGKIPEHWKIEKVRHNFNFGRGLSITKRDLKDEGIPCLNYGEIHSKYGFKVDPSVNELKKVDEEYLVSSIKSLLDRGDFVFADTSEDIEGSGNFSFLDSDSKTFAGYHTVILRRKRNYNYKYIAYFFDSIGYRNQIRSEVYGIKVFSITQAILKDTLFVIPPSDLEQIAIANYLDEKTEEIDQLISDKRALVHLYKKEKTAIINQAMTKGINNGVTMKDSEIEWLGVIPKHWQVKKLKYIISEKLKYGANESANESNIDHPRYIRITDFDKDGNLRDDTYKSLPPDKANDFLLSDGDILFARSGATVGKTFQFKKEKGESCFAGYLIKASPNTAEIESDFLYYFTQSGIYEEWKNSIFNQATIQNIGADKYSLLNIPFPPDKDEQIEIIKLIDFEINRINFKISSTENYLELLEEYRTALINNVVTGKIKVTDDI